MLRLRLRLVLYTAAGFLAVTAVTVSSVTKTRADELTARIEAVLARRGLGPDALAVIDNVLRHEAPPPPFAPSVVRELLGQPFAAVDARGLFDRLVPDALRRLVGDGPMATMVPERMRARIPDDVPAPLAVLLAGYLDELAEAQKVLRTVTRGAPIDTQAIIHQLDSDLPSADQLLAIAAVIDMAALDRATVLFLDASARFVRAVRDAAPSLRFPDKVVRFDSAVGPVVIGTNGDDVYGPDAAVIIDPGGNDVYERAPVTDGAVSVIVDLGGDDQYRGADLVVDGLSAIFDLAGNDRYAMSGPGLGAAIAGVSVLVDFAGDDSYETTLFGEGAAAFGLGALIDLAGNDAYRLRAGGQGFGMTAGVGILWDRGGNDIYFAAPGLTDVFERGGGRSHAQGAAFGFRTMLGGGIGILRDDAGDDVYEAEMFAQGVGFYYGIGLLWDRGGDDRYRAVRYAQGNGIHEAIGILRDDSGNDRYELAFGVGQGMGLDLAVGVLFDGAGDDRFASRILAQGTATANGVGLVFDGGGGDAWSIDADYPSWGRAEWSRGLPSLGLLLYEPTRAAFTREGQAFTASPQSAELGGPFGGGPIVHEAPGERRCPIGPAAPAESGLPLAEALRTIAPIFAGGAADLAVYVNVSRRLTTGLRASIATLPHDDFAVTWAFGEALRCAIVAASPEDAAAMWADMQRLLVDDPATQFAGPIAGALRDRPPPIAQMQQILRVLDEHPRCSVRVAGLSLRFATAKDDAAPSSVASAARDALKSPCWRLQAAAGAILKRLGLPPAGTAGLPSFLQTDVIAPTPAP
jgi:hypothetical protein